MSTQKTKNSDDLKRTWVDVVKSKVDDDRKPVRQQKHTFDEIIPGIYVPNSGTDETEDHSGTSIEDREPPGILWTLSTE